MGNCSASQSARKGSLVGFWYWFDDLGEDLRILNLKESSSFETLFWIGYCQETGILLRFVMLVNPV